MTGGSVLTLQAVVADGRLASRAGGEIAFQRVVLEAGNRGARAAEGLRLNLEALQGKDPICRLDEPLDRDLGPGEVRRWDLYDLFLDRGRGFPSKVHLFGVKAAIGWDFTVRASVGDASAAFRFRWSGDPAGPITAVVEALP